MIKISRGFRIKQRILKFVEIKTISNLQFGISKLYYIEERGHMRSVSKPIEFGIIRVIVMDNMVPPQLLSPPDFLYHSSLN